MPTYRYKAVKAGGETAVGVIDAPTQMDVIERLRDQGMMPISIALGSAADIATGKGKSKKSVSLFASRKVTREQLMSLTRELATLLRAGLPLDRALETLIALAEAPPLIALLQGIRDNVRGGRALSQALEQRPDVFTRFYINLVRAGEAGGALSTVLTRLADTMERNKELRETVKSAMIYPTILLIVAVLSVIILLIWVVPQFETTFAQSGKALPIPTQIVVWLGAFMKNWWWTLLIAAFLFGGSLRGFLKSPKTRAVWDAWVLRRALIGDVITRTETARFARTLATLIGNGVTLLSALAIVKDTMTNLEMARVLDGVIAHLREGRGFGKPLADTGRYPKLATQMIIVGEESGRLEEMLMRVADIYDREVQIAVKRFLSVLEPVMILSLAVVVFMIVLSIMLGIIGMTDLVR
ncbi:MAG: type II secretion system F family protein [Proteobacteria bacterium]|nr:type II secretion system F family protein [Pseudomonadota bacterium]MCL2307814.1 type II secretion system F family protein [Pseudomonadota bacterium]